MKRSLLIVLAACCLILSFAPPTPAAGPNELLQAVPGQAWGMVSVRSLAELDKKVMDFGQTVNAPTVGFSPLAMAKGALGLLMGVNDNGGLALVVMPAENLDAIRDSMAILIPTTSYTELLSLLEPEDVGDGLSKILLAGNESYVAQKGNFAVAGPTPEIVKAVLAAQAGIAGRMTPYQIKRWEKDDLTVWLDVESFTASPAFTALKEEAQTEGVDPQLVGDLVGEFKSAQLSLRLAPDGIDLGVYFGCRPGSEMAQALATIKPAPASLLTGLPAESLVFAMGKTSSKEYSAFAAQMLDKMMASAPVAESAQPAFARIRAATQKMLTSFRTSAMGINTLSEGGDGLCAMTLVLGVDGSAAGFLASVAELVEAIPGLNPPDPTDQTASFVSYKPKAEEGPVDHLVFDPTATGASQDDLAGITKVLGPDGLTFRLSAVDSNHVAITLGGGSAHMKRVAELVKGQKAPLAEDADLKLASTMIPAGCTAEGYLSANGLANLITAIAGIPLELPPVKMPVTMYAQPTEGGGMQIDMLLPTEVLKATGQAMMGVMGGGPPGSTAPQGPGSPQEPTAPQPTGSPQGTDSPQGTGGA